MSDFATWVFWITKDARWDIVKIISLMHLNFAYFTLNSESTFRLSQVVGYCLVILRYIFDIMGLLTTFLWKNNHFLPLMLKLSRKPSNSCTDILWSKGYA